MLCTAGVEERITFNDIFATVDQTCLCQARHIDIQSDQLSSHGLAIAILGKSQDVPCGGLKRSPQI